MEFIKITNLDNKEQPDDGNHKEQTNNGQEADIHYVPDKRAVEKFWQNFMRTL
jgi:hypothetical protein